MTNRDIRNNPWGLPHSSGCASETSRSHTRQAVILNSHQCKQPLGSDRWIENTAAAVAYATGGNFTIMTSFGINTYELVIYLGAVLGSRMLILVPSSNDLDSEMVRTLIRQFNLNPSQVAFHAVRAESPASKSWWLERDRVAISQSDLILPVCINPSGRLRQLVGEFAKPGAMVDDRFSIPYRKSPHRLYHRVDRSRIIVAKESPWHFVTHWTRSFNGPWPGQNLYDYYRMVTESGDSYSHSALNTLERILVDNEIRGTSEHIRGGYSVVSLTGSHPADAVDLMRWRARFMRWNFEPYGIAIDIDRALSTGIRPVIYGDSELFDTLPEAERPYYQNIGQKPANWENEREWRYHGDLRLSDLKSGAVKIIVRRESEIDKIRQLTSLEVIALTDEG